MAWPLVLSLWLLLLLLPVLLQVKCYPLLCHSPWNLKQLLSHPPGNFHSKFRIKEAHAIDCDDFCHIIFLVVETGSGSRAACVYLVFQPPLLLNYGLLVVNDANSMLVARIQYFLKSSVGLQSWTSVLWTNIQGDPGDPPATFLPRLVTEHLVDQDDEDRVGHFKQWMTQKHLVWLPSQQNLQWSNLFGSTQKKTHWNRR